MTGANDDLGRPGCLSRQPKEVDIMAEGLVTLVSRNGPAQTMDRLAAAIAARGAAVLARVDHAKAAAAVGLTLQPTEVVIFGNPRAGTVLMQSVQTLGIDLPLRALVWMDGSGVTHLSYNDPEWLARRHGAAAGNETTIHAMRDFLAAVAGEATR
jgi:uncharacterized protein (DUF302 family)